MADYSLKVIPSLLASIAYTTLGISLLIRNIRGYRANKKWNWARHYVIISMLTGAFASITNFLFYWLGFQFTENWVIAEPPTVSVYSVLICLVTVFGFLFVIYINQWTNFGLFPFFVFLGAVALYMTTGFYVIFSVITAIGAIISMPMIFEAAIRIRDDNVLGIGIFMTMRILSMVFPSVMLLDHASLLFGLIYAFGGFKFFSLIEKRKEKKEMKLSANTAVAEVA